VSAHTADHVVTSTSEFVKRLATAVLDHWKATAINVGNMRGG
jgi:hypothetical protein